MGPDATWIVLVIAVLAAAWVHHEWHVRRYPERVACKRCEGSGNITNSDWLGRKVRGPCPRCQGNGWTKRRRSER